MRHISQVRRFVKPPWLGFVWPEKPFIASFWGKLPLLVWNQGSQQELLETLQPLYRMVKTASRVPVPSLRGWGICMECVLAVRQLTADSWPEATWGCFVPRHLDLWQWVVSFIAPFAPKECGPFSLGICSLRDICYAIIKHCIKYLVRINRITIFNLLLYTLWNAQCMHASYIFVWMFELFLLLRTVVRIPN